MSQISLPWQRGSLGENAIGSIPWPISDPPYRPRRKNLAKISYASRIIANFVPNFVVMATEVGWRKMRLAAFDGPFPKTPYRRKNLLRKLSYSPFCPEFRCPGNGGRSWKNAIGSIRWPIPKTPYRRKNLAKISYASQVIAHFVPNFVAMATREGPG